MNVTFDGFNPFCHHSENVSMTLRQMTVQVFYEKAFVSAVDSAANRSWSNAEHVPRMRTCSCGHCQIMPKATECICCQEIPEVSQKLEKIGECDQGNDKSSCITDTDALCAPDKFYGYPNDDMIDWFASFERIARANEWDAEKSGRMVSAFLRGPAGDHFEKIEEVDKTNFRVIKQLLID
eukprot:gene7295-12995_t